MSSTQLDHQRPFSPEFGRKVLVSKTSLEIDEELSFDEWVNLGEQLTEVGDSLAWWVGDWVNQGKVRYGGKYEEAMQAKGLPYQTVANYAHVARRFESYRRRENLTWSHHADVAPLDDSEQDALLDAAAQHGWSIREMRDHLRGAREIAAGESLHVTLERLTLTVPEDRAERWKHAADEAGLSFQEWCAKTLDEAASA